MQTVLGSSARSICPVMLSKIQPSQRLIELKLEGGHVAGFSSFHIPGTCGPFSSPEGSIVTCPNLVQSQ